MCEQWIIENCDINVTVIHLKLWMFLCFSSPAPARDKSDSDWLPVGGACVGKCFLNFLERNGICLQTDMWALVLHTCSSFNELWSLYSCCLKINFFLLSQRKQVVLLMRRKRKTIKFTPGTTVPSSKRLMWMNMDIVHSLFVGLWSLIINSNTEEEPPYE